MSSFPTNPSPPEQLPRFVGVLLGLLAAALWAGCASRVPDAGMDGCAHNNELPPLQLSPLHKRLLAGVSASPRTALDYYLLLPKSCFSIMPHSRERRVTYIDTTTLSDDYLHASRWFECDGGGFEVTLKLYRTPTKTFVVLKNGQAETIFDDGRPREGEPSVAIDRPSLWLYSGGAWRRQPGESIPSIPAQRVLSKYHHDGDADRQYIGNDKSIWIDYVLSPSTNDIVLMGRENFQRDVYEYGRLVWRGSRFALR